MTIASFLLLCTFQNLRCSAPLPHLCSSTSALHSYASASHEHFSAFTTSLVRCRSTMGGTCHRMLLLACLRTKLMEWEGVPFNGLPHSARNTGSPIASIWSDRKVPPCRLSVLPWIGVLCVFALFLCPLPVSAQQLTCGWLSCCVLNVDGYATCWGSNDGSMGNLQGLVPTKVQFVQMQLFSATACGLTVNGTARWYAHSQQQQIRSKAKIQAE
jgi:hypothetical protein